MSVRISHAVGEVLERCKIVGDVVYLPDQLDRDMYVQVNRILELIGGKWNRKAKGHVFESGQAAAKMEDAMNTGEVMDLKEELQYFPTPSVIAKMVAGLAELDADECLRVLEPSAGTGNLATAIYEAATGVTSITAVEKHPPFIDQLSKDPRIDNAVQADFLEWSGGPYDRVVMNPPFSRQQDVDHVRHAYDQLAPGGVLVSVMSPSWTFRTNKKSTEFVEWLADLAGSWFEVEEGAFKESGTNIRTVVVKVRKPSLEAVAA